LHQGGEGFEDSAAAQVGGALSAAASGSPCGKPPESQQDAGRCKPTESQQDTVVEKYVESEQPVELEKHVQSEEQEDAACAELAQPARAQVVATEVAERSGSGSRSLGGNGPSSGSGSSAPGRCKPTESQQDASVETHVKSEQPVEFEKHVQSEELEDAARAELAQLARAQAVATEVAERSIRRAEEHPEDFSAREAAKRAHAREREAAAALQRAIQRTQKLMAPRSSGASCRGHSRAKPRNLKPMQKKNGRHVPD